MNVVSLFTGVGGFDLGLERAGHRIVAQCEADEKARAVLRRHWPDVPIHEDVCGFDADWCERQYILTAVGTGDYRRSSTSASGRKRSQPRRSNRPNGVDLVCGGFPCQDLSVAGKRAGLAGERSGLFFEAARISDLVLGDGGWVLIENVPGLLSSNGGRDFAVVLATLADLGFHDLAWRVLDSRFFGVPQRRRRVFILARRASGRRAAEVLLEPESGGGDHQASRETRQGAAATFGVGVAGTLGSLSGGFRTTDLDGQGAFVANTLQTTAGDYSRADGFNIVTSSDLRESASGSQGDAVLPATDDGRREAGSGSSDGPDGSVSSPPDTDGVRTPPGIPGRMDDPVTCPVDPRPDGPRYAQMGNAVTVNVAQWIGERLRDFG